MAKLSKTVNHYSDRIETLNENGRLHSFDDEPSIKYNSSECYHNDGVLHRKGGPAIITDAGTYFYYINGVIVSKEEATGIIQTKSSAFDIAMKYDFPREEAVELIKYLSTKL